MIKWLIGVWVIVWCVLHLRAYPAATFLWFCAYGNVVIAAGVLLESRFLLSWQAVALLVPQAIYIGDALVQLLGRRHAGGTAYLFDAATPFAVRALSLFHFVMPLILAWSVVRLGYDRRALPMQLLTSAIVLPLSYSFGAMHINEVGSSPEQLLLAFLVYALIYVATHIALVTLCRSKATRCRTSADDDRRS
jgi:hypothetical protein